MTRQDIVADYTVDENGIIRSPGKFEGEQAYAVWAYDVMLNGFSEIVDFPDECRADLIDVDAEVRKEFPEIDADTVALELTEGGNGFVYVREFNQKRLDLFWSRHEKAWEHAESDAE